MTAENILELTRLFYQLEQEADTRNADCRIRVLFQDGERLDLQIVSTTHMELDETVIAWPLLPDGAVNLDHAIQFSLEDVEEIANYESRHCLFRAEHN